MIKARNLRSLRLTVGDIWEIDADLVVDPPPPKGKDRYEIPGATAVFTSGDFQPFCDVQVKGRRHTHIAYQRLDEQKTARWYIFDLVMGTERPFHLRDTVGAGQSAVNEHFAWLPDGRFFYLSGNQLLLHVNPYKNNAINKGWTLAPGYQYRMGTGSGYAENFVKRDKIGGTTEALIHITEDGPQEVWNVRISGILNGFHAVHVLEDYGYAWSPKDSKQQIVFSCRWDGSDQKNLEGDQQRWSHQAFDGGVMAVNNVRDDSIDFISENGWGGRVATGPMSALKQYRAGAPYVQSQHHQLVGRTLYCSVTDFKRSNPLVTESGVMRIDFDASWVVNNITTLARGIKHPGPEAGHIEHWEGHLQPAADPAGVWICYRQDGKLIVEKQESV